MAPPLSSSFLPISHPLPLPTTFLLNKIDFPYYIVLNNDITIKVTVQIISNQYKGLNNVYLERKYLYTNHD